MPHLLHSWCKLCESFAKKEYFKTKNGKHWLKKYSKSKSRKLIKFKFNHSNAGKNSQRKYRQTEGYKLSQLRYRKTKKAKLNARLRAANRRFKLLNNGNYRITKNVFIRLIDKNIDKYGKLTCTYCKKHIINFHIDHIKPVSLGGTNHINNLCISCPACNFSKRNKPVRQFLRQLERK